MAVFTDGPIWKDIDPDYPFSERFEYWYKYLTSKARRLTIKHYKEIVIFAAEKEWKLNFLEQDYKDKYCWKGMHPYDRFEYIEEVFAMPMKELPLYLNVVQPDPSTYSYVDHLNSITAKWRLKNGI